MPTLRALLSFETVAGFSSFSKAAQSIGMTHGAISHQMRTLEDWLGQPLFDRHSGGVRLTRNGERLKQVCKDTFAALEEGCRQIREDQAAQRLSLGCSTTFLAQWLLPRFEAFVQQHPALAVCFQTRANFDALLDGSVDVLILSGQPRASVGGVTVTHLASERIGPVCAPGWPDPPVAPDRMLDLPLLHASSKLNAWSEWGEAHGVGLDVSGGAVFESLTLSVEAAKGALGFAIAPEFLVRSEMEKGTLIAPLGFHPVDRETWIYTRDPVRQPSNVTPFVTWLLETERNAQDRSGGDLHAPEKTSGPISAS
ncbi:LysR substrate-binding domain-containing protein [Caballeronia sp. LZ065]|uniref:LysR substrate-binding domain-containing protein n=1 Tax=Caballeronia sp. LZ065 TaxID=3038571 RepID=UPI00286731A2|nr:LysR substrate-binding domain-containing protein [Caballeronia sp. LZ065]MDR5784248.1 LysR substrate-binding domain-containing protein [Caballeronia sp. LZ065]